MRWGISDYKFQISDWIEIAAVAFGAFAIALEFCPINGVGGRVSGINAAKEGKNRDWGGGIAMAGSRGIFLPIA